MNYPFKTKKTKYYEKKMQDMIGKSFDYKFKHKWTYYDGYTSANFDRSRFLSDYRDNLRRVFVRVNKFRKLSKEKQKEILDNPYSCGNYHITFDMGYIDFYKDTKKKRSKRYGR